VVYDFFATVNFYFKSILFLDRYIFATHVVPLYIQLMQLCGPARLVFTTHDMLDHIRVICEERIFSITHIMRCAIMWYASGAYIVYTTRAMSSRCIYNSGAGQRCAERGRAAFSCISSLLPDQAHIAGRIPAIDILYTIVVREGRASDREINGPGHASLPSHDRPDNHASLRVPRFSLQVLH